MVTAPSMLSPKCVYRGLLVTDSSRFSCREVCGRNNSSRAHVIHTQQRGREGGRETGRDRDRQRRHKERERDKRDRERERKRKWDGDRQRQRRQIERE